MSLRRVLLGFSSLVVGLFLITLLIKLGKVDLRSTFHLVGSISRTGLVKIVLVAGVHIYLANEKWRLVDRALRRPSDHIPSRITSFALTSTGVALGQVLPVQISMSVVRTLGTYLYGGAFKRGTVGTIVEQGFDVVIVLFLSVASGLVWFCGWGFTAWIVAASIMIAIAFIATGPMVGVIAKISAPCGKNGLGMGKLLLKPLFALHDSGLLNPALARRLLGLSAMRFFVQVFLIAQVTEAIGSHIRISHVTVVLPLVVLASSVALTPGGMGVSEISFAVLLHAMGTPLNEGAQWAIANRLLIAASCAIVTILTAGVLCGERLLENKGRSPRAKSAVNY